MFNSNSLFATVGSSLILAVVLTGCSRSPATYPVTGNVTFDGKPIPSGTITFRPVDERLRPEAASIKDGEFALRLPTGTMKLEVSATRPSTKPAVADMGPQFEDYIPPQYSGPSTTLKIEVTPTGPNRFDLPLKK